MLRGSPDYCELEPAVFSTKTITSDFVHPAPTLISSLHVVPLRFRCRVNVHVVSLHATNFRVILCWAIFELPLIRGDVVPGNGHVENAMH